MRQKPIDNFIVDFFCGKLSLIIEIDGISHYNKFDTDDLRQKRLEKLGFSFLRFSDLDVKKNIGGVLSRIESWIEQIEEGESTP